jgi:C-terminal binding protein
VILDKADGAVEAALLERRLGGAARVRVQALDVRSQAAALETPLLPFADVVMVWHTIQVDAALIRRMPRARALVRVGVGYDNVDLKACAEAGLPVCNVPAYGTEEVADHAMSLVLNLFRRTTFSHAAAAGGEAAHGSDGVAALAKGTRRIRGCTLGLLGCGRIGTATALRAKPFGLEVVFYDPNVPDGTDKALGVRRVASARALAEASDCVSVHCDLNPTSRGLVDAAFMRAMRPGSFIVNTARGGIVDERALRMLLDSGHIAGAGIDVHEVEPFVGDDQRVQPLARAPNCICTPHTAFFSEESFVEMRSMAASSAADALLGVPLANVVNARQLASAAAGAAAAGGALKLRAAIVRPRE